MQIQARHYRTNQPIQIEVFGDVIGPIGPLNQPADSLPFVAPGFFDPQVNGHGGTWFCSEDITPHSVLDALKRQFGFGITRVFPTLITAPEEALAHGFQSLRRACDMEPWANELVAGFHLEGPFISAEEGPRGAHPVAHVRPADWDEFTRLQDASGNRIRLVTLAPEVNGAIDFIRKAVANDVVVALGHTNANSQQIADAVAAGATMSTHLGNGVHPMLPRHPNCLWDQLAEPRLIPSIIPDGFHLPDNFMRAVIAAKGISDTILTSDASGLAGSPAGKYEIHGTKVEVREDSSVRIANSELLAGSGASLLDCVGYLVSAGICELPDAIEMAGCTAARHLKLPKFGMQRGCRADLILFETTLEVPIRLVATIAGGAMRYCRS